MTYLITSSWTATTANGLLGVAGGRRKGNEPMNADIRDAAAGLSGTILVMLDAVMKKGLPKRRAYAITQAILLDATVKMIDAMREEHTDA